jgi:hypothetical protein
MIVWLPWISLFRATATEDQNLFVIPNPGSVLLWFRQITSFYISMVWRSLFECDTERFNCLVPSLFFGRFSIGRYRTVADLVLVIMDLFVGSPGGFPSLSGYYTDYSSIKRRRPNNQC